MKSANTPPSSKNAKPSPQTLSNESALRILYNLNSSGIDAFEDPPQKKEEKNDTHSPATTTPLKEIVFEKSIYEYDYSKEVLPTSDAGKNIREILSSRKLTPSSSSTSATGELGGKGNGEAITTSTASDASISNDNSNNNSGSLKKPRIEEDYLQVPLGFTEERNSAKKILKDSVNSKPNEEIAIVTPIISNSTTWTPEANTYRIKSGILELHNEIISYTKFISSTPTEMLERQRIAETIRNIALDLWPESRTEVFGSAATDLSLPNSDVDIVVFGGGRRAIYTISSTIRSKKIADQMEVIDKARIPIVKLKLKNTFYQADVSFDVESGGKTVGMIQRLMEAMPEIRPLVLVVKQFLAERELNDTFRGGVGSFLCFLTVVASVQRTRRNNASKADIGLGKYLLDYFDLFGNVLNYRDVGISLLEGGCFFEKRKRGWYDDNRPFLLSMENPESVELDVGKNSWAIENVKRAFTFAYKLLAERILLFENKKTELILDCILNRKVERASFAGQKKTQEEKPTQSNNP